MQEKIDYPYLPEGRAFSYVPTGNYFMDLAKRHARKHSLDKVMPGAAVVVLDQAVIGVGANGSEYHDKHPCKRVELGCKSGEGYELCEGCHPNNHSEPSAIQDAIKRGKDVAGGDLYLWGHWWCCESCWRAMEEAGIKNVYLLEGSEVLFNKEHPDNVVGVQFA